jgi:hypothetical protein
MTDTTTFYRTIIGQVSQFVAITDEMRLISDRIGADSSLSSKLAASAQAGGRTDLTVADFDNLKAAIDAIDTLLNSNSPSVNAPTVKLPFYVVL